MSHQLRVLDDLVEDTSLDLSTHIGQLTAICNSSSSLIGCLLLTFIHKVQISGDGLN